MNKQLIVYIILFLRVVTIEIRPIIKQNDGYNHLIEGSKLYRRGFYQSAAFHFWNAVLFHDHQNYISSSILMNVKKKYNLEDTFRIFIQCYTVQSKTSDAFLFVAQESFMRGQNQLAVTYLQKAISIDKDNDEMLSFQKRKDVDRLTYVEGILIQNHVLNRDSNNDILTKKNDKAIMWYNIGSKHFKKRNFALAEKAFDKSCQSSKMNLGAPCVNAIYCRMNIMDWGYNGSKFMKDMNIIQSLTLQEKETLRIIDNSNNNKLVWRRMTSVHPHMMLGYIVDSTLKRYVAESYAMWDEYSTRYDANTKRIKEIPADLPYNINTLRPKFILDSVTPNFRIRVAFVSSGFSSKAVLYLSQYIFQYFDRNYFEIHVFSLGDPDDTHFVENIMRGVDWRDRVRSSVDFFHDTRYFLNDHIGLARKIRRENVHILIDWDGYARQGSRSQGLFALKPAPLQILHQEFLMTSGSQYVDYIITDKVVSPENLDYLYTEHFIYMPHHFFSKGHAVQKEVKHPTYNYRPKMRPYQLGTGSPQENHCLSTTNAGPSEVSFVFCNFNKFLKVNPETVISWIHILRSVPNSILCLLQNPASGIFNFRRFVSEYAYEMGDGNYLNSHIHFLPWQPNPFDHQIRNHDFCNVNLDSYPYNGHTTAQDALYAGVPIVTRSDGLDMSSRVTTSANVVLGLTDLNSIGETKNYENISIKLALNTTYFKKIREKLIASCIKRNPMHPYWDVARYVRNIENGLRLAWDAYLSGKIGEHHLFVLEEESNRSCSYD